MNEYITRVLEAVTNPELAGAERERLRERLARAGLLAVGGQSRVRPDAEAVAAAGREAAVGTPLSDLIRER